VWEDRELGLPRHCLAVLSRKKQLHPADLARHSGGEGQREPSEGALLDALEALGLWGSDMLMLTAHSMMQ
jgi:hypothetical protein